MQIQICPDISGSVRFQSRERHVHFSSNQKLSLAAVEEQTSATSSQGLSDTLQLMPDDNDSQPDSAVSSNILAIVEGIEVCSSIDSGSVVWSVSQEYRNAYVAHLITTQLDILFYHYSITIGKI